MKQWTTPAEEALANYLSRIRQSIKGTGADPVEVVEDLRSHVRTEIAAAGLEIVTEQDVQRILARIGPIEHPPADPANEPIRGMDRSTVRNRKIYPGLLFFGVILPIITLLIEIATHMCAG